MYVSTSLEGVDRATHALEDALDIEVARGLERGEVRISNAARTEHTFTNRTGRLESGIQAEPHRGTLSNESLSGRVVARTSYASYVEDRDPQFYPGPDGELIEAGKYSYLAAAWGDHSNDALQELDAGIQRAIESAGW